MLHWKKESSSLAQAKKHADAPSWLIRVRREPEVTPRTGESAKKAWRRSTSKPEEFSPPSMPAGGRGQNYGQPRRCGCGYPQRRVDKEAFSHRTTRGSFNRSYQCHRVYTCAKPSCRHAWTTGRCHPLLSRSTLGQPRVSTRDIRFGATFLKIPQIEDRIDALVLGLDLANRPFHVLPVRAVGTA